MMQTLHVLFYNDSLLTDTQCIDTQVTDLYFSHLIVFILFIMQQHVQRLLNILIEYHH